MVVDIASRQKAHAPNSEQESHVPQGWKLYTLNQACSLIKDGTHLPPARVSEGPLLLSVRNMQNGRFILRSDDTRIPWAFFHQMHSGWQIQQGDVLLAIVGATLGKSARVGMLPPFTVQRSVAVLRGRNDMLTNDYLALIVQIKSFQDSLWRYANQTAQPGVYLEQLGAIEVEVPSLVEQRQIAEVLDTVEQAIRQSEQLIMKLKQMKQGLLHHLLTRGVDDSGELRDLARNPDRFRDTPLGLIPCDWKIVQLQDVSEFVTSGSRGWAAFYADDGPLFIRIGNLTRDHINLRFENLMHVRPPTSSEGQRTKINGGDLLMSITADLGIVGVVPPGLGDAYINQHIALIRIDPLKASSRWLGHYLAGMEGQKQIRRLDDPGAKAGLNLQTIRKLYVALPPRAEQDQLTMRLDAIDENLRTEFTLSSKLHLLKQGLMEDLLTGRVRVTNLETTP